MRVHRILRMIPVSLLGLLAWPVEGGGVVTISAPYKGGWIAAVVKK